MFSNILHRVKNSLTNTASFTGTSDNREAIGKAMDKGKSIEIANPTSQRTFTKGEQGRKPNGQFDKRHYSEGYNVPAGKIDIGDTRDQYKKGDGAQLGEIVSTAVRKAKYNPKTKSLYITFAGGGTEYEYPNVPPEVVNDMIDAPSKGRFVNEVLKPQYSVAKNKL